MKYNEAEVVITIDEMQRWKQIFEDNSAMKSWLAGKIRNPADAMIHAMRDMSPINTYFPNNVNLFPIEQLRVLGIFDDFIPTKLQRFSNAKHTLQQFQFKLTHADDAGSESFISDVVISIMSEQQAQFALSYIYTLTTLNNLFQSENYISSEKSLIDPNSERNKKIQSCTSQFVEYILELERKAKSKQLVRDLLRKLAKQVGKDISCSIGMTRDEILVFTQQLTSGVFDLSN